MNIRRPCRTHEPACQTESARSESPISNLQISKPPQISPQRPCAFRPADPKHASSWFCDFPKTIAAAERGAKKLCRVDIDANMHQKCKLRQSQICRSLSPLKSPPSAPAHSARPPKNDPRADFVIFKNQKPVPSRKQKNYGN